MNFSEGRWENLLQSTVGRPCENARKFEQTQGIILNKQLAHSNAHLKNLLKGYKRGQCVSVFQSSFQILCFVSVKNFKCLNEQKKIPYHLCLSPLCLKFKPLTHSILPSGQCQVKNSNSLDAIIPTMQLFSYYWIKREGLYFLLDSQHDNQALFASSLISIFAKKIE